jgi:Uma2 family endonuclease
MTTAMQFSELPVIEYPEIDGLLIADNTLQFRWIATIMWGLEAVFLSDPNVFVAADLLWYPVEGQPTIRTGPDVLVAFGRPKGDRGSCLQWREGNLAPQVVFEVLSPESRPGAMGEKFEFYQRYGVEEYYIYDPDDGEVLGWLRVGSRLEKVADMSGFVSPRLGIRFEPGEGRDNLKLFGPDGSQILSFLELTQKAEEERRRADAANERAEKARADIKRARADIAQARADAASQRAERLAARLRELGLEPE